MRITSGLSVVIPKSDKQSLSSTFFGLTPLSDNMPVMDGPRTAGYLKDLFPEVLVIKDRG